MNPEFSTCTNKNVNYTVISVILCGVRATATLTATGALKQKYTKIIKIKV